MTLPEKKGGSNASAPLLPRLLAELYLGGDYFKVTAGPGSGDQIPGHH